jgi:hypothetical protein
MTTKNDQLAIREDASVSAPVNEAGTMARLLEAAIDKNVPVEALEKLVTLNERIADRHAAQEFNAALARFQRACPAIIKNVTAQIATKSGAKFSYKYAPLDDIVAKIREPLHAEGLSYSWDSSVNKERAMLKVVCTVSHVNGHCRSASFEIPWETEAGMSQQQKFAAALSFGQRKSLEQALGISSGEDTDGADPQRFEKITDSQAADLLALIQETKADKAKLLKWVGVASLEDIPAARFAEVVAQLNRRRAQG